MFYAQVQSRGSVSLSTIARRIQQTCTVTRADIMGTLAALEQTICEGLANGEIIRLGELGSLQMLTAAREPIRKKTTPRTLSTVCIRCSVPAKGCRRCSTR